MLEYTELWNVMQRQQMKKQRRRQGKGADASNASGAVPASPHAPPANPQPASAGRVPYRMDAAVHPAQKGLGASSDDPVATADGPARSRSKVCRCLRCQIPLVLLWQVFSVEVGYEQMLANCAFPANWTKDQ